MKLIKKKIHSSLSSFNTVLKSLMKTRVLFVVRGVCCSSGAFHEI